MEILLHIVLEPLFYAYYSLVESIFGENRIKKSIENFLKILCLIVSGISLMLIIIGIFWLLDDEPFKTYGLIMLIVGASIILIHILIAIFVLIIHSIEDKIEYKKIEKQILPYQRYEENEPKPIINYTETNEK